jgi:hypothetical protein
VAGRIFAVVLGFFYPSARGLGSNGQELSNEQVAGDGQSDRARIGEVAVCGGSVEFCLECVEMRQRQAVERRERGWGV